MKQKVLKIDLIQRFYFFINKSVKCIISDLQYDNTYGKCRRVDYRGATAPKNRVRGGSVAICHVCH